MSWILLCLSSMMLALGSTSPLQAQQFAQLQPCYDFSPPNGEACNCTACMERGSNWRHFTQPRVPQMSGSLSFAPPIRACLQVDSEGRPIRPTIDNRTINDYQWGQLQGANVKISNAAQCPEKVCPQMKNCANCTQGTIPCTWRGPAPALKGHTQGVCMFVGDTGSYNDMTIWKDRGLPDQESRRNCSARGLLKLDRTRNLCSSVTGGANDSRSACVAAAADKHAVCLRIDNSFLGFQTCRSECDSYLGACRGVSILFQTDACFTCLLFEECLEPSDGERHFLVSGSPPAYGDWIFSTGGCPGGCESYRFPGVELPPTVSALQDPPTFRTPWYSDHRRCLQDARCQFCIFQFPTEGSSPSDLPHRAEDPGCFDRGVEPYRPPGLTLTPDVKPFCAWDGFLGKTPATACAQHETYAACAGSASIGCQWCLSTESTNWFRQNENATDPTLMDRLMPRCLYYMDAVAGCLSLRSLHSEPAANQIPLLPLFHQGKLYDPREQACGAHQLYENLYLMVADNSSQADPWYLFSSGFDVSSSQDIAGIPMSVPPSRERDVQLARMKSCVSATSIRTASKECQQFFSDTCSACLRTPGCWWSDNALESNPAGDWSFNAYKPYPGCFSASAQQTYVGIVSSLSTAMANRPLRALTVPEDAQFCFDPCWQFDTCGSCLAGAPGKNCQWCDFPDYNFCVSVSGPYQVCLDKYTRQEACPVPQNTQPKAEAESGDPTEPLGSRAWTWYALGGLAVLVCLPGVAVWGCIRKRRQGSTVAALGEPVLLADMVEGGGLAVHHSHVELRFSELGFRAKVGQEEKQILKGVTGSVSSGEFLAVMGPSGSGKTTFLDVLAKRKLNLRACDGVVQVNGRSVEDSLQSYCGGLTEFVPQQDTLLAVHTVTEMLRFVADLKLPATTLASEKDERVREVISMVGLQHRAHAFIGSNLVRGLSGGERRRAMIASALVPRPPVLFLDEPTSGLSSTDSLRVVEMLGKLAKSHGYAVIAVVHQPQSRLFGHFDKLLLVSQGEVCYVGSARDSVAWFEKVTATKMPSAMNPADWLLDIVTPGFIDTDAISLCKQQVARERGAALETEPATDLSFPASEETSESGKSRQLNHTESPGGRPLVNLLVIPAFNTGSWRQFRVVLYRCFQAKVRSWRVLVIRLLVNLGVGVIAGSALPLSHPLYVHPDTTEPSRQINAVLFFVVTYEGLISLTVLPLFAEERELFAHERKAKFYRVLPYFVANLLAEATVQAYSSLVFGIAFYVIVGLSHDWGRFLFYLLTTVLVGDCASAFAQCCSSASRSIVNSLAICAMGLGVFLLFSGFLVLPGNLPFLWRPLYHMSFWKYGFQALTINEYAGAQLPCQSMNYSMAANCPPFGFHKDCPLDPCMNKSSGNAAAIHEYRRFNDLAEVSNAFLTSDFAGRFFGSADARQINCRMLCGNTEAPGRYDGDDCVCASFQGCRNSTKDCDEVLWRLDRGSCPDTRQLNGAIHNETCALEIEHVAGEYFLDALGFGRVDADGKPMPQNDPELEGAPNGYMCIGHCSTQVTKYVWLGVLIALSAILRAANFLLLFIKHD